MILKTLVVLVLIALVAAEEDLEEMIDYVPTEDDLADLNEFDLLYGNLCNCSIDDSEPICGSNGKSYRSVCQFRCARQTNKYLSVRKIGLCADDRACEVQQAPKTQCHLKYRIQKTLKKLYRLNCKACGCSMLREPLCGSDGKTYANMCIFKCRALTHDSPLLSYPDACNKHGRVVDESYTLGVFKRLYDTDCTMS